MEYTILGRTGLKVSVMGLGCGGHSRLGLSAGKPVSNAVEVVRKALSLGVNIIDTAEAYGTEQAVGHALDGTSREAVVLSTKISPHWEGRLTTGAEVRKRVGDCLRRLRTDWIDILHLHGVAAGDYAYCASELAPTLMALRDAGLIRYLGITEAFASDPGHRMMVRAIKDDCWDVLMVGFNILNQSARRRLFARTRKKNIGVLCMFAVRRALSQPEALMEVLRDLALKGLLEGESLNPDDLPDILLQGNAIASLPDIAYRFCRHEPGIDVVLSGTGDPEHLESNAASLTGPPLSSEHIRRLKRLFRRVDCVSGN